MAKTPWTGSTVDGSEAGEEMDFGVGSVLDGGCFPSSEPSLSESEEGGGESCAASDPVADALDASELGF